MENLHDTENIYRPWENIKDNIKISAEDSLVQYEWKQAIMQWLQDPNQSNAHNLNNVRHEPSRHFRNKKNISKLKLMILKLTVRPRISENCKGHQ